MKCFVGVEVQRHLFIPSALYAVCFNFTSSPLSHLYSFNPSAWGHLNPSSYCDVGRLFYGVFKLWPKLQRKK